ncbi:MAG: hypothetical protein LCH84_12145 [Gemmatimonadetes bacterium]|nr:hypothetical protein [Gemmatimonadota bacterium]
MIDLHTHLLPGVDDGSPSFEVSEPVLRSFAEGGVATVVCTPHLNASQAGSAAERRMVHEGLLSQLRARVGEQLTLLLGWEIMLDAPNVDLRDPAFALGESRALLVEFTRGGLPPGAGHELRRIARLGRTPVLAHPERYFGCTLDMVREWRRFGVVIQTDASVLMGRGAPSELARAMLAEGLIDILASDNHGDHRTLVDARAWLSERGASEQLALLTAENASRVLADEDTLPVPPLPAGLMDRVRRLFGRG